jgi:hypothetical protein
MQTVVWSGERFFVFREGEADQSVVLGKAFWCSMFMDQIISGTMFEQEEGKMACNLGVKDANAMYINEKWHYS